MVSVLVPSVVDRGLIGDVIVREDDKQSKTRVLYTTMRKETHIT